MVFYQSVIQIPTTAHAPLSGSGTPVRTAHHLLPISGVGATVYCPWSISGYYQNRSVIEGETRYPR